MTLLYIVLNVVQTEPVSSGNFFPKENNNTQQYLPRKLLNFAICIVLRILGKYNFKSIEPVHVINLILLILLFEVIIISFGYSLR